jgi:hypothetical protein
VLRDRLAAFVDRTDELAHFRRALAGEEEERLLLIVDEGERGKSFLLLKLLRECEEGSVPVVLLDFDEGKGNISDDYLDVARAVRRYLTDACTSSICACDETIHSSRGPLVYVRTGGGEAGINWGQRGRFEGADVSDVAARDNIHIGDVHETALGPDREARWRDEMGRALRDDLAQMSETHSRVVLLVDTFEQAQRTCRWLERWLFDALRRELAHVLVVVAGRPQCDEFFASNRPWSRLIAPLPLTPLSDDDIEEHLHQCGFSISDAEWPLLLKMARPSPGAMARVADLLDQAEGGTP